MTRRHTIFLALCLLFLYFFQSPVSANPTDLNKSWSTKEWLAGDYTYTRPDLFAQLLKKRNLIGLSRKKVEKLLGVPNKEYGYRLSHDCGGAVLLRIEYTKNRVQRWRFESCGYNGHAALVAEPWVETNVVLNREDGHLVPLDVVPKSKPHLKDKKLHS